MMIITHSDPIDITTHDDTRRQFMIQRQTLELKFDNPQELAEFVRTARLILQASWTKPFPPSIYIPI